MIQQQEEAAVPLKTQVPCGICGWMVVEPCRTDRAVYRCDCNCQNVADSHFGVSAVRRIPTSGLRCYYEVVKDEELRKLNASNF